MTLPLTNGDTTSLESPKMHLEVVKEEERSEDKVKGGNKAGERGEKSVAKVDLTAQSTDDKVTNTLNPRLRDSESEKHNGTKIIPNAETLTFNADLQCSTVKDKSEPRPPEQDILPDSLLNLDIEAVGVFCPSSSIWNFRKHPEVSSIGRNLKDNNTQPEKNLTIPQMEKCGDQIRTAHIHNKVDTGISSQLRSPLLLNAWSPETEHVEKKQVVESTVTVPFSQSGPFTETKGIPAPTEPECKESFISGKKDDTEVNVSRDDKQSSDDGDIISSKDLLCISWQIAQGMVSVTNRRDKIKKAD